MSDAATAERAGYAARNGAGPAALSPEAIDRILADFREWLEAHGAEPPPEPAERVDLETLVAQFTALRHEVNLQTKASRTLAEAATKLIDSAGDEPAPMVKTLLDIADVLAVSAERMNMLRITAGPLLKQLCADPPPAPEIPQPGLFSRIFGTSRVLEAVGELSCREKVRSDITAAAAGTLRELADSAADGYAMSLRRVERAFPDLGLEPIECLGRPFDPETMEVLEVGDGMSGTVTAEIRRGYRCNGRVVRYAQVRVAR